MPQQLGQEQVVIDVALRAGNRLADYAVAGLKALGWNGHSDQKQFPAELLIEIGALVQLCIWDRAGMRDHLPVELPDTELLFNGLLTRLRDDPNSFLHEKRGTELLNIIQQIRFCYMALEAFLQLGVDIAWKGVIDDSSLEPLIEFLWRFRHLGCEPQIDSESIEV